MVSFDVESIKFTYSEEYCVDAREQNRTEKFTDDFRQLRCKQIHPNQLYFHSYAIRTGRQFDI